MNIKIKHLFFDLDRTLWDYDTNSKEVLLDVYENLIQSNLDCSFEQFHDSFRIENQALWDLYNQNLITKAELRNKRFFNTLKRLTLPNTNLALQAEEAFVSGMPSKNKLFDGVKETLEILYPKYSLHILSNGFEEIQEDKLLRSGIRQYFNYIITSDVAGANKPSQSIFNYAFSLTGARADNSIMIGDDPHVDGRGALNVGMAMVLFNTSGIEHNYQNMKELCSMSELPNLLKAFA